MNRETYHVTALRPDCGLDVTSALSDSDMAGERMVRPASYVNEHLTLSYALTVPAAQGQSVDTSHSVVTSSTSPAAVYVAMSRGREADTAHVMTPSGAQDPAQGREYETLHRDPIAVLAGVLADADQTVPRSALATATESADERGSVRHAAELLADAAQMAATERTATWLDHLVDTGARSTLRCGAGSPPSTAPRPWPGYCVAPSSPATTRSGSSPRRLLVVR